MVIVLSWLQSVDRTPTLNHTPPLNTSKCWRKTKCKNSKSSYICWMDEVLGCRLSLFDRLDCLWTHHQDSEKHFLSLSHSPEIWVTAHLEQLDAPVVITLIWLQSAGSLFNEGLCLARDFVFFSLHLMISWLLNLVLVWFCLIGHFVSHLLSASYEATISIWNKVFMSVYDVMAS